MGSRNLLTWFSSLERVAAGGFMVLSIPLANRSVGTEARRGIVFGLGAAALGLSGAEVYFGLARSLPPEWGFSAKAVGRAMPLVTTVLAGLLALSARGIIRSAPRDAKRALLLCCLLGLASVALELVAGLASNRRAVSRLEVGAFATGYFASLCLLWATYAWHTLGLKGAGVRRSRQSPEPQPARTA